MTTMTHPDYRNQGVFSKLAEHLYGRMAELGVCLVWGFPNTQSHYGFIQRLGWRDIALVVTMTREADYVPSDAPVLTSLSAIDHRTSDLLERSKDGRIYPAHHTVQYLQWRYVEHP